MTRVTIDEDRCQGHTLCHITAPTLFGLRDEDGHAAVLADPVPPEFAELARRSAAGCPERAIIVADGTA
jgi:ferredoxin